MHPRVVASLLVSALAWCLRRKWVPLCVRSVGRSDLVAKTHLGKRMQPGGLGQREARRSGFSASEPDETIAPPVGALPVIHRLLDMSTYLSPLMSRALDGIDTDRLMPSIEPGFPRPIAFRVSLAKMVGAGRSYGLGF